MKLKPTHHVVLLAFPFWGNTRPMCQFVAHLLKTSPKYITFLISADLRDRAEGEIGRHFDKTDRSTKKLITFRPIPLDILAPMDEFLSRFRKVYEDTISASVLGILPFPELYICDVLYADTHAIARSISQQPIRVVGFGVFDLSIISLHIRLFEANMKPMIAACRKRARETKLSYSEIAFQNMRDIFINSIQGKFIRLPDLPLIADYELMPQDPPALMPFGRLYLSLHECLNHLEGLITPTSRALEPLTCFHIETYLRRRHAFLYPIGPLLPPSLFISANSELTWEASIDDISSGLKSSKNNKATQSTTGKIEQFLNFHLSHKGERSVLYIAFGSVFFPRPAENLWAFLDVVVELDIPFILARPQSHAIKSSVLPTIPEVPDNILASLAANENTGVICDWAPQQFILSHPATGWFLTHCGINSVQESLLCGVPMICWPICGDQPLLAIRLTQELGCGIELNEVHSGHGKKRRTSNDVTPWVLGRTSCSTLRKCKSESASLRMSNSSATSPSSLSALSYESVEVQAELVKDEARSVLNTVFFGEDGRLVWQRALQMKTKLQRAWDKHGDARKSLRRFILDFMTE